MSRYSYEVSKEVILRCDDFDALVMAAMRKADTNNFFKLCSAFPDIGDELKQRYNAPGGVIPSDPDYADYIARRDEMERRMYADPTAP